MEKLYIENVISIHLFYSDEPAWHAPAPRSAHYLAYHTSGKNIHKTKNNSFRNKEDTLLFLSKNDAYDVVLEEPTESICVVFTGDTDMESFSVDCKNNLRIRTIFKKLLANNNLNETSNLYYCLSALYEVFHIVDGMQKKEHHISPKSSVLQKAFDYIETNYLTSTLLNSALADMCSLSERRFTTLFKEYYGETPRKYILRKKIDHASNLLLTGIYTIEQVSEICGFTDVYYFNKMFKRYMNITPGLYKKSRMAANIQTEDL